MSNPYEKLPPNAFWRTGVADLHPLEMRNLWEPKFSISKDTHVATAGSCFAQHISRAMRERGYSWLDSEPAPDSMEPELRKRYNYGIFSFRTGNIYTPDLLWQWVQWSLGLATPPEDVFEKGGRFFDPFRPGIEPDGYDSSGDVLAARSSSLRVMASSLKKMNLLVFTLGLTEGWYNKAKGYCYPVCPGTIAGEYDPEIHEFHNSTYSEVFSTLKHSFKAIKAVNPKVKFLLTVSPVPLTATAASKHVLVSTTYSKSVLRAVAGAMANERADTDYFPSYEIITGTPYRAMFFDPNLRTVTPEGVKHVMSHFFSAIDSTQQSQTIERSSGYTRRGEILERIDEQDDLVCEELAMESWNAN